jgi:hypothetical protein
VSIIPGVVMRIALLIDGEAGLSLGAKVVPQAH